MSPLHRGRVSPSARHRPRPSAIRVMTGAPAPEGGRLRRADRGHGGAARWHRRGRESRSSTTRDCRPQHPPPRRGPARGCGGTGSGARAPPRRDRRPRRGRARRRSPVRRRPRIANPLHRRRARRPGRVRAGARRSPDRRLQLVRARRRGHEPPAASRSGSASRATTRRASAHTSRPPRGSTC